MDENRSIKNDTVDGSQLTESMSQSTAEEPQLVSEVSQSVVEESQPATNELQTVAQSEESRPTEQAQTPDVSKLPETQSDVRPKDKDPKKTIIVVLSILNSVLLIVIIVLIVLLLKSSSVGTGSDGGNNMQKINTSGSTTQESQRATEENDSIFSDDEIDDSYFVSDGTKYVMTMDSDQDTLEEDGYHPIRTHIVYTYLGEKITSLISYLEYKDASEAKKAFNDLVESGEDIDGITVNGKYLVQAAPFDQYKDLTTSEVKEQIELWEQLKKMDEDELYLDEEDEEFWEFEEYGDIEEEF